MRKFLALIPLLFLIGCGDNNLLAPSEPTGRITAHIEYRVTGNATGVIVRHSSSSDGLSQITTSLPFVLPFDTDKDVLFLSLEATPVSFTVSSGAFTNVQIFVNGQLFREATSNGFFGTVSVSGTWRK